MIENIFSATKLTKALKKRTLSTTEVVDIHLSVLEKNKYLNALVIPTDPQKLYDEAKLNQKRINQGDNTALIGVPLTVKDVIAVEGLALTGGSLLLANNYSKQDATVVHKLRKSGVFIAGKTNCPEFGFGVGTNNDLFGPTQNPWGSQLSPGGSSGGEAVSVSSGISLVGIGSDFGGSLRWPAQCNGVLALRPTPRRVSGVGQIVGMGTQGLDGKSIMAPDSLQGNLQVPGFVARCVDDLENLLFLSSGYDKQDFLSSPVCLSSSNQVDLSKITIGWSDGSSIAPVKDEVSQMILDLAIELEKDGFKVKHFPNAFQGALQAYNNLRAFDDLRDIKALSKGREDKLSHKTRQILSFSKPDNLDVSKAWVDALIERYKALELLSQTPIIILPVAGGAGMGVDETMVIQGHLYKGFELMAHCRAVSLLATPVVSIPVAQSVDGLPLSVQVVGLPWAEDTVLAVAKRLEFLRGGWQQVPNRKFIDNKKGLI